jgi:hypothetical protein
MPTTNYPLDISTPHSYIGVGREHWSDARCWTTGHLPTKTMADHTTTDDDEKASDDGRLDPRVREHVEEHGSPAHGYDYGPERVSRDNRQRERGDR